MCNKDLLGAESFLVMYRNELTHSLVINDKQIIKTNVRSEPGFWFLAKSGPGLAMQALEG